MDKSRDELIPDQEIPELREHVDRMPTMKAPVGVRADATPHVTEAMAEKAQARDLDRREADAPGESAAEKREEFEKVDDRMGAGSPKLPPPD